MSPTPEEIERAIKRRALALLAAIAGEEAQFRPGQWEAIREVVAYRRRVLVVQRTGWGKSAVYLIATSLLRGAGAGPTVIVSPLLALMRNQIEMGERAGVFAATINSTNRDDWDLIEEAISDGRVDILLISPERLNNPRFREEILGDLVARMGMLVVDEAHCISDWGHDFRPDYRRLSRVVELLPPNVPVLGTTATANDRVVGDVVSQLGDPLLVIRGPLDRDGLALQVFEMPHYADRLAWLVRTIPSLPGSGIVYCLTVRDAERVGRWLVQNRIVAATYTGRSEEADRLRIEQRLSSGGLKVVVATSALGMGYDNPLIEFVVHFQAPGSPIAYYQQVGRAGRAVTRSVGVLLSGEEDGTIQDYFISTAFPSEEDTSRVLEALAQQSRTLTELEAVVNTQRSRMSTLLKVLEVEGAVYREGSVWFRSGRRWTYPTDRVRAVTEARRREQAAMRDYLSTDTCLMQYLRSELDDPTAGACGQCTNCVGGPSLPASIDEGLRRAAMVFLRRSWIPIPPRKMWPPHLSGPSLRTHGLEPGRALCRWGDPGYGAMVAAGKYNTGRFADELVAATVEMVRSWAPDPAPTWVCSVPNRSEPSIVADFAARLARQLRLPYRPVIERVRAAQPQKGMENSYQQVRNQLGSLRVLDCPLGPVLLVDDLVDSRWTFTVVGALLREVGVTAVYPCALADSSRSEA